MRTATIPPVRIEPEFRKQMEDSLVGEEGLASLVETAVRHEVARQRMQSEFVRRGLSSIQETVASGNSIAADVVLANLENKLTGARRARGMNDREVFSPQAADDLERLFDHIVERELSSPTGDLDIAQRAMESIRQWLPVIDPQPVQLPQGGGKQFCTGADHLVWCLGQCGSV